MSDNLDYARWEGEDSIFTGFVVSRYRKLNGKPMVVLEDNRGLNHIYPDNPKRLVTILHRAIIADHEEQQLPEASGLAQAWLKERTEVGRLRKAVEDAHIMLDALINRYDTVPPNERYIKRPFAVLTAALQPDSATVEGAGVHSTAAPANPQPARGDDPGPVSARIAESLFELVREWMAGPNPLGDNGLKHVIELRLRRLLPASTPSPDLVKVREALETICERFDNEGISTYEARCYAALREVRAALITLTEPTEPSNG